MFKFSIRLVALLVFFSGFFSCNKSDDSPEPNTIARIASSNPQFSVLVKALRKANLFEVLNGSEKYTVFAPTNAAMASNGLTEAFVDATSGDLLRPVLLYHVVKGERLAASLTTGFLNSETTADLKNIRVTISNGKVILNGYSSVTTADLKATNGVIHIIDDALNIPGNLLEELSDFPEFSLLVSAIKYAELDKTIETLQAATIFAPTNDAFKKIKIMSEDDLKEIGKVDVANLLLYHVVPATVFSEQVVSGNVTTANDNAISISVNSSGIRINNMANVVSFFDIYANNGVIHTIDRVLFD